MRRAVLLCGFILGVLAGAQTKELWQTQRQHALTLEQQGDVAQAEDAWRKLSQEQPANPEPWAHMGLLEARQERYKEAVLLYRKALERKPSMPGLHMNLGLALFKDGQMKEAIAEFSELLKIAPAGSAEAQRLTILIGMAHYGLGEYAEAIGPLQRAADADKENLPLRLALAHSCLWTKNAQCVLDAYHQILDLNAESAEADMLAAEALDEMKDSRGAIEMFRAAVRANPREPDVHYGLGYLLWTQKQYAEAESEFRAELANDPEHLQSMLYLADSMIQSSQLEEARPWLEKLAKRDPQSGLGHLDLGIVYAESGRNDEALRELSMAEKLIPEDVNVHWRLGRLYRVQGKKEDAKAEFERAAALNKASNEDLYKKLEESRRRGAPTESRTMSGVVYTENETVATPK